MAIPKIIHVCWWQNWNELPERFQKNIRLLQEKNPDYKIIGWDEKSIRDQFLKLDPKYLAKIQEFKYIHQKVDLSRIILMWMFGGVSTDVDVVALKGFDEVPNINTGKLIVSYNSSNGFENFVKNGQLKSFNNATIISAPNNPILRGLADHFLELSCSLDESKEKCIQHTTGPQEFTNYLSKYSDQIIVLPNIYLEPCGGNDSGCEINPEVSILDHQHEGSWVSDQSKNISRIWYGMKRHRAAIFTVLATIILFFVLTSKTKTS